MYLYSEIMMISVRKSVHTDEIRELGSSEMASKSSERPFDRYESHCERQGTFVARCAKNRSKTLGGSLLGNVSVTKTYFEKNR